MAIAKICGWVALGLAVAILQGWGIFWYRGYAGSFLSETGFKCTAITAVAEFVLLILVARNLDELFARSRSNPHSMIGDALRRDMNQQPPAPPTRKAWDGGFENMDDASANLSKDR